MSLRKGWLNRQFVRVDADVQNWPIYMKVEASFATREQTGQGLPCSPNEKPAAEVEPMEPVKNEASMTDKLQNALDQLSEVIDEVAKPPDVDSDLDSLLRTLNCRALVAHDCISTIRAELGTMQRELDEAEAELEKVACYAKLIRPGAHSVYEVLDQLEARTPISPLREE